MNEQNVTIFCEEAMIQKQTWMGGPHLGEM